MSILSPYLQRRGDIFSFRIAVPSELRHSIGKREFIQSLHTTDKRVAVVKALMLAATAKQLFHDPNKNMTDSDNNKLMENIRAWNHKHELNEQRAQYEEELEESRVRHKQELKQAKLEAENGAIRRAISSFGALAGVAQPEQG